MHRTWDLLERHDQLAHGLNDPVIAFMSSGAKALYQGARANKFTIGRRKRTKMQILPAYDRAAPTPPASTSLRSLQTRDQPDVDPPSGPVQALVMRTCQTTNLPWSADRARRQERFCTREALAHPARTASRPHWQDYVEPVLLEIDPAWWRSWQPRKAGTGQAEKRHRPIPSATGFSRGLRHAGGAAAGRPPSAGNEKGPFRAVIQLSLIHTVKRSCFPATSPPSARPTDRDSPTDRNPGSASPYPQGTSGGYPNMTVTHLPAPPMTMCALPTWQ